MTAGNANRSLDEWYKTVNSIYLSRNFYRDSSSIFMHLVEVIGGLTPLASRKIRPGTDPAAFLPKAISWWLALCGKVGVSSVEAMVWAKFPGKCPYCHEKPHLANCGPNQGRAENPDWKRLRRLGANVGEGPRKSIAEWQAMFFDIYPADQPNYERAMSRLLEELAELAEALRIVEVTPKPFLNEATDVFAWLMNIANGVDTEHRRFDDRGTWLQSAFANAYPDSCIGCGRALCACPPLLDRDFLRQGEVASDDIKPLSPANILSPLEILEKFRAGAAAIHIGAQTVAMDEAQSRQLQQMVNAVLENFSGKWQETDQRLLEVLAALNIRFNTVNSRLISPFETDFVTAGESSTTSPFGSVRVTALRTTILAS